MSDDDDDGRPGPVLVLRGLTVQVAGRRLLDDVDLDLLPGRVHVLLGPSGSGKTTLMRALLGLTPPRSTVAAQRWDLHLDEGVQDMRGAGQGRWRGLRGRAVGMVGQDPALALTPLRRVGSLVGETLRLVGRDDGPAAVDGVLGSAGLGDHAGLARRRTFELSGGMAQRLGLGLALAGGPGLLLADEPSTALDPLARAALVRRLVRAAADGAAVLLTTHDGDLAREVGDDVTELAGGRVVRVGPAAEVLPGAAPVPAVTPRARPEAPGPDALALVGVEVALPGTGPVLRGLDLVVGAGEVVGLAGRSGAGKTTALRCVVGLQRPTAGRVVVGGADSTEVPWPQLRRRVQVVPQDPRASLNPWRTAAQLVEDSLVVHRLGTRAQRQERVAELLDRTGLAELARARPPQLSTGQCQRVAIARAIAVRPALLVADEPVTALDAALREDVLDLLAELTADSGTAVLVISHDLGVLTRLCDRVAVLDEGRVVEDLPAADLARDAEHPLTRAFLAAAGLVPAGGGPGA